MRLTAALAAAIALAGLGAAEGQMWGPPRAVPWPRWEVHQPADGRAIDHGEWDRFLGRYLDRQHPSGIHRVSYRAVTAGDRRALEAYLGRLQATAISGYGRPEQQAFWINLYNATTVKVILDHYPVKSIRAIKLSPGWFSVGPWDAKILSVESQPLSLNDVEHRILRPIWRDPRLHYAVNCASLGCPNLAPVAYTGATVDRLLTEGAVAYVNHPRGVRPTSGGLRVSSIYDWFQSDFGGSRAGVLAHLRQYAQGALAERLSAYDGPLDYEYDWSLNEP